MTEHEDAAIGKAVRREVAIVDSAESQSLDRAERTTGKRVNGVFVGDSDVLRLTFGCQWQAPLCHNDGWWCGG